MEVVEWTPKNKKVELYLVGDTHYPRGKRKKLKKVISEINRKKNAYLVGMGDWVEGITQNDPRYNPEEIAEYIAKHGSRINMIDEQWYMFEQDIKILAEKGKILGLHAGNHGSAFARRNSYNELYKICRRNNIKYLGDGMAVFNIKGKKGKVLMLTFHGSGGGTTIGSNYNKLERYGRVVSNADIIAAGHCFDEETEILTKDGWKKYTDIGKGTEVMTYNLKNGNAEWNKIQEFYTYNHYKELIHFKNKSMDLMVTPDHSIVGSSRYGKYQFKRIKAKDVFDKRVDMPNAGINTNDDYNKYSDDELKLIAWIITEGCYEDGSFIRISQSVKPKVGYKRITDICDRLGIKYAVHERNGNENRNYPAYRVSLKNIKTNKHLVKIKENFSDKKLNDELLKLSNRQFKIFFNEIILGDGNIAYKSIINNEIRDYQYSTKYEEEADILQSLCAINGYRTSKVKHGKVWAISINTRGVTSVSKESSSIVEYNGTVWCPTVKNQTVIVRRNGKVIVSGNTHKLGINVSESRLKYIDGELKSKTQYQCSTGSFLGNYDKGVSSYSERKAFPPLPMGYIKITIEEGVITDVSAIPV